MSIISVVVTKNKDGSLKLTAADDLPTLLHGNELRAELSLSDCDAPWKADMMRAQEIQLAAENARRARNGLAPLGAATAEAFDASLSKQVAAMTALIAQQGEMLAQMKADRDIAADALTAKPAKKSAKKKAPAPTAK